MKTLILFLLVVSFKAQAGSPFANQRGYHPRGSTTYTDDTERLEQERLRQDEERRQRERQEHPSSRQRNWQNGWQNNE
jgi:hypothetical protein